MSGASIKAEVRLMSDGTAQVLARAKNISDDRLRAFAHDVVVQAKENAASLPFKESQGDLAREIYDSRIGDMQYQIETKSGHASYIEFGTRFIEGKMPFLWPAYRAMKRKLFGGRPWV